VQNKELLQKLSICKPNGAEFVSGAKLAVVVCGDENIGDVWIEDASIASIILQLTAHSLGIGSCWVQIRNRRYDDKTFSQDYIKNLLNIENNLQILSIIALGHPAETKKPLEYEQLQFDKIKDIL
jgi:nitroreductase